MSTKSTGVGSSQVPKNVANWPPYPTNLLSCFDSLKPTTLNDGDAIESWPDSGDTEVAFIPTDGDNPPIYKREAFRGRPAMRITSPAKGLTRANPIALNKPCTLVTLFARGDANSSILLDLSSSPTTGAQFRTGESELAIEVLDEGTSSQGDQTQNPTAAVVRLQAEPDQTKLTTTTPWTSNGAAYVLNNDTDAPVAIGSKADGNQPFAGDVFCILVYNRSLTDSEVSNVIAALRNRYGF